MIVLGNKYRATANNGPPCETHVWCGREYCASTSAQQHQTTFGGENSFPQIISDQVLSDYYVNDISTCMRLMKKLKNE